MNNNDNKTIMTIALGFAIATMISYAIGLVHWASLIMTTTVLLYGVVRK